VSNVARMLASGFSCVNREAIKYWFDGVPMDSPRGAEQRAVVDPHHEPTGCALAQLSGDLCGSRALRAPQGNSESLGSPSFGYFSWRSKKSDWPRAATERAGGTRNRARNAIDPHSNPLPLGEGAAAFMVRRAHCERIGCGAQSC